MATPAVNILVVDDDTNLLTLLIDTLTAIGYRATGAANGAKALELLALQRFDLTITDIKMPEVDGIQLLRRIRRYYPEMPVLFITGVATPDIIGQATPNGFLAKPFRISLIEDLIEKTLNRRLPQGSGAMRKVLVVDSDDESRAAMMETLSINQYLPFSASGLSQAAKELDNGVFDVVIAELPLSNARGVSIERILKERCPDTPVLFLTDRLVDDPVETDGSIYIAQKPLEAGNLLLLLDRITSQTPLLDH